MRDPRLGLIPQATPEEERDFLDVLRGSPIEIRIGADVADSQDVRCAVERGADLCKRLFDTVQIYGPASWIEAANQRLGEVRDVHSTPTGKPIVIALGSSGGNAHVGFSGWRAAVSLDRPAPIGAGRIGALLAGPMIAAEAFKTAFASRDPRIVRRPYSLDALTYGTKNVEGPTNIPHLTLDLLLAGGGSIGFGIVDALVNVDGQLSGEVEILDNGHLEDRNIYKYAWLPTSVARANGAKVEILKSRIHATFVDLNVVPNPCPIAKASLTSRDSIIVSLDDLAARRKAQELLPRILINAAIDGTTIEIAHLLFGESGCLYCYYLDTPQEDYNVIASMTGLPLDRVVELYANNLPLERCDIETLKAVPALAELDVASFEGQPLRSLIARWPYGEATMHTESGGNVMLAAPFVSSMAGTLALIELIKAEIPELEIYRLRESLRFDMLGVFDPVQIMRVQRRDECGICNSQPRLKYHKSKWASV